jgi:hypothetical protein
VLTEALCPEYLELRRMMLSTTNYRSDFVIIDEPLVRPPGEETPDFDETSSVSDPYARRVFRRTEDGRRGEFSHHVPHKEFIRRTSLGQLPQYLYRATHNGSRGVNMEGHYKSHAVANGFGKANFYEFDDNNINISLDDHVSQKNCQSHWISFTDSAITVFCRALQFLQNGNSNVRIHVIDTFKIKSLTLIVHSYAMLRGYRVCIGKHPVQGKKLLGSAYAEFLVWDELVVEACSASITQLIKDGLLELMPELELPIENHFSNRKRFKQPSVLRKQLYKGSKTLKEQEWWADHYYSGPRNGWKKEVYVGALPKKRQKLHLYPVPQIHDKRFPLEVHKLNRFRHVARCWRKPQFLLVMLVAMLSMKTDFFVQDEMVDNLVNMPLG